jgi:hypothetical protein
VNAVSLFSGVGGMDEGLRRAGFRHVLFCEADAYRRAVLAERFPGVAVSDDVRSVGLRWPVGGGRAASDASESRNGDGDAQASADLLCGGFPCQDLSVAGHRAGLAGERSGLFFEFARVAELFDPDGFSSRTYPVSSLATAVGTSESCLPRWPTSGTAWPGGFSTAVSSECRSDGDGCSSSEPSLTEILEPPQNVPPKYSLSARAAAGILRRAAKRGRELPAHLQDALQAVSMTPAREEVS